MKKKVRHFATVAAIPATAVATLGIAQVPAYAQGITQETCNAGTQNWVHLGTTYHGNVCIGYKGHEDPGLYIRSFCPGNNYGTFVGHFADGSVSAQAFRPGGVYAFSSHFYITDVTITSWKNNSICS